MVLLGLEQTLGFMAAAVLITLSPGPDNLMVLSLGMARGRRQGMVFGLGCALGCLSHTLLAALGVSALLAASPAAFSALKLAGGLYLIWLGWQAWQSRGSGLLFTAQAAVVFGLLGYFAGHAGSWLNTSRQRSMLLDRIAGSIFALLGLKLMLDR
jgi:threonine/homoserine/homoserine lactone efflux protein